MEAVFTKSLENLFPLNGRQEVNETFDFFIRNDAIPGGHAIVWTSFGDGVVSHIFPFVLVADGELA
jgi:hypothetical protein